MTNSQIMIEAAALIRKGWCQFVPAVDVDGREVDPYGEDAVAWCASGAIRRAAKTPAASIAIVDSETISALTAELEALNYVLPNLGYELTSWNDCDERTAEEVISFLERVAARLAKA